MLCKQRPLLTTALKWTLCRSPARLGSLEPFRQSEDCCCLYGCYCWIRPSFLSGLLPCLWGAWFHPPWTSGRWKSPMETRFLLDTFFLFTLYTCSHDEISLIVRKPQSLKGNQNVNLSEDLPYWVLHSNLTETKLNSQMKMVLIV